MPDHLTASAGEVHDSSDHVLFFAAMPPLEIKAEMKNAWQNFGTGEALRYNTLHLSIYGVTRMPRLDQVVVQRAQQAAAAVRTAPFTRRFDRVMTLNVRDGSRPLAILTDNTINKPKQIAADLHAACRARGLTAAQSQSATPHVTMAYGRGFHDVRYLKNQ